MNPRKVGPPAGENIDPLEMFLPESPQTGTVEGTTPLDLGEFALRRSSTEATTLSTPRLRPRRSVLRSVVTAGFVVASTVLALIAGAAVRNRLDGSALLDSLATALLEHETLDEADAYAAAGVPRTATPPTDTLAAAASSRIDDAHGRG